MLVQGAIRALIDGPNEAERAAGYFSELRAMVGNIPSCRTPSGFTDLTAGVQDGVATVRFCRFSSAGVGQDARAQSAIEATLRQFPSVQRILLLTWEGDCLFDMSGENRCRSD